MTMKYVEKDVIPLILDKRESSFHFHGDIEDKNTICYYQHLEKMIHHQKG